MLAVERRNLILEKLQEDKKVIVSELSQEFQAVSYTHLDVYKRQG